MKGVVSSLLDDEEYKNGILFPSFRTTKKRNFQDSTNSSSMSVAKRIVPKLGPSYTVQLNDTQNIKNAAAVLTTNDEATVNSSLNYLLGWSTVVKEHAFLEEVKDVVTSLLDMILKFVEQKAQTSVEHFEKAQFSTLVSTTAMQCSMAGAILKNLILSSEKSFEDETLNSKAVLLLLSMLTTFHEMEYSLMRDLMLLSRKVTAFQEQGSAIANGLISFAMQTDFPLRLRLGALGKMLNKNIVVLCLFLDALSDLVHKEEVQETLIQALEVNAKELRLNLKILALMPMDNATKEAQLEFDGCLDYEGLALLSNSTTPQAQKEEELKLWAWKLQSEALLSMTNV